MKEKLKDLQQLLCILLAIITILSIFPINTLADDNEHYGGTDEEFFVSSRDELKQIFNLDIQKAVIDAALGYITGGGVGAAAAITGDVLNWLAQKYTFVVVKKYTDPSDNRVKTKVYVNAPNIQQLIQNVVTGRLSDGWESRMWTPEDKLITSVGKVDAGRTSESDPQLADVLGITNAQNVMTKFGFNIPVPRYSGEYPSMYMSMNNVIPTKWYQVLWRLIKSVFGFSFIDPPDDENFKTLGYWGTLYTDVQNEQLIQYIQKNWLRMEYLLFYDDRAGGVDYFGNNAASSELECAELATTTNEYNVACENIFEYLVYRGQTGKENDLYFVDIEEAIAKRVLYRAAFKDLETFVNAPAGDINYKLEKRANESQALSAWKNIKDDNDKNNSGKYYLYRGRLVDATPKPRIHHESPVLSNLITNYINSSTKEDCPEKELNIRFEWGYDVGEEIEYTYTQFKFGDACRKNQHFTSDTLESLFPGFNAKQTEYWRIKEQLELCEKYYTEDHQAWENEKNDWNDAWNQYQEDLKEYKKAKAQYDSDRKTWKNIFGNYYGTRYNKLYKAFKSWEEKRNSSEWKKLFAKWWCEENGYNFAIDFDSDYNASDIKKDRDDIYYNSVKTYSWNEKKNRKFVVADKIYKRWNGIPTSDKEPVEPTPPDYPTYYDPADSSKIREAYGKRMHTHENKMDSGVRVQDYYGEPLKSQYYLEGPNKLEIPDYFDLIPESAKLYFGWTNEATLPPLSENLDADDPDAEKNMFDSMKAFIKNWNDHRDIQSNYRKFNRLMNNGTEWAGYEFGDGVRKLWKLLFGYGDRDNAYLYYSQCLLNVKDPPDKSVENCKKVYGETTVYLTLFHYIIASGAWLVTKSPDNQTYYLGRYGDGHGHVDWDAELTREDAIKIILCLQSASGPAMEEGWKNLVKVYEGAAAVKGITVKYGYVEDNRIMPYDRDTLISSDKKIITIYDPRVTIYKNQNLIGGIVTGWHWNIMEQIINQPTVFEWFSNIVGKITRLTVFINRLCSFEFIEKADLSPATMWKKFSSAIIISLLMAIFIIQIIIVAYKYATGKAGIKELFSKIIIFILLLTIIVSAFFFTDRTWNTLKRALNLAVNLGETAATSTIDNIDELYGDKKDVGSVNYYLPYFNLWTKFMTGYGINANEQLINSRDPEAEGMLAPSIVSGGTSTKLWAVALADSFNKNGENKYIISINPVNGNTVNKNAYRAVDHFLAPRLRVTNPGALSDGHLYIENKDNENYNGKFQNMDIATMISGVLTVINLLIIVVIKFLTFLYLWYMLYILVFNILLSSVNPSGEGWKLVLLKTFSPALFLILLGLYAGLVINLSIVTEGFIGILLNVGIFFGTGVLLSAWRKTNVFPKTLEIVYVLFNPILLAIGAAKMNNKRKQELYEKETGRKAEDNIDDTGKIINDDELDLDQMRNYADVILMKAREGETLTEKERSFVQRYHLQNAIDNRCRSIKDYKKQLGSKKGMSKTPENLDEIKQQFWFDKEYKSTKISQNTQESESNTDQSNDNQNNNNNKSNNNE